MAFIEQEDANYIQNVLLGSPRDLEDTLFSILKKKYVMNVTALDDLLKAKHGYTETKHGSIKDFISNHFGENDLTTIMRLLGMNK